jgi:hypothetical protein
MPDRCLPVALLAAALLPAASFARPITEPAGAARLTSGVAVQRDGVRVVSQPTARAESGIVRLTCGGSGLPGTIGSRTCSIYGGGDLPFSFPFGPPPTGADLAAAKQVMRIDHVQVRVGNVGNCFFSVGVADPGGGALGFPGPLIRLADPPTAGADGQFSSRITVPGIDMEFTTLSCDTNIVGADIQIYYTLLPRGR